MFFFFFSVFANTRDISLVRSFYILSNCIIIFFFYFFFIQIGCDKKPVRAYVSVVPLIAKKKNSSHAVISLARATIIFHAPELFCFSRIPLQSRSGLFAQWAAAAASRDINLRAARLTKTRNRFDFGAKKTRGFRWNYDVAWFKSNLSVVRYRVYSLDRSHCPCFTTGPVSSDN